MKISKWHRICKADDINPNAGVCALIEEADSQKQVAIFKLFNQENAFYAIGNYDPIGKANVLYRGIVGSVSDEPVVASPLYKQHFSLISGKCLQEDDQSVPVYQVREADGFIELLA